MLIDAKAYDALSAQKFAESISPSSLAIILVVFLVIWKDLWKVIEKNIINLHFTGYWHSENSTHASYLVPFSPSLKTLSRDYVRTPPLWLTFRALAHGDLTLCAVSLVSILWEALIMLLGFYVSMSVSSGSSSRQWHNIFYANLAITLIILILWLVFGRSAYMRVKYTIGPQGGIASMLGSIANSESVIRRVERMRRHIADNGGERNAKYRYRRIRSIFRGQSTYGIEPVRRERHVDHYRA